MVRGVNEAACVAAYVSSHGGDIAVSRGVILHQRAHSNWVDEVDEYGNDRLIALYVSKTLEQAELVRAADEVRDDAALGSLFGYPPCCVAQVAHRKVPAVRISTTTFAYPDGTFDPWIWPPAMVVDRALLTHFPCGPDCEASRAMARKRLHSLQCNAPEIYEQLIDSLSWSYYQDRNGTITILVDNLSMLTSEFRFKGIKQHHFTFLEQQPDIIGTAHGRVFRPRDMGSLK